MMQQSIDKQKLSLFKNLQSVPSKAVGLDEVLRLIRYDSSVAVKTERYRTMMSVLGKQKADDEVKQQQLPAVSVAVLFDDIGRKAAHILGFTGLALVDVDHIGTDRPSASPADGGATDDTAALTVDEAFERVKHDAHTVLAYRTVSGQGLRVLYRYQREQADGHIDATSWPAVYAHGNEYYARLLGVDYDHQCGDYTRLCGLCHDEDVYVNWQAEPFIVNDEEILAASFDSTSERGKARKEYPAGTNQSSVEDAWQRVEPALQRKKLVYQAGNHHDYVMHAAFLFNRYGVDLDDLLAWAAQEWSDYDGKQREATIRSCYKKTLEHGTWRLNRQGRRTKENSMISIAEIKDWLRQRVEVIYNLVTDQSMYRLKNADEWAQLDNRVVCSIRSQMAIDTDKRVLKSDVTDVLSSDFARLYHPIREYIDTLPQWDGTDRVKELCSHIVTPTETLVAATPLMEWALHKWLVAMVATWMSDYSTNHEIMVLIGPQGIYKTTFFRHLLPPALRSYFWENAHNSFSSKDDHLALAENCLVEIEEIDLQNPRDISELKGLATSDRVKERRPYARFREEKHRLASFCGTGNQQRFLSDETGNRRWLCFLVTHIDDPRQWGIDYSQLYAQLRDELRQGFRYWFDADEQRIVERQNDQFRIESDEEQLIRTRLRKPGPAEKITLMNAATICQFINNGIVGRGLSTRKVAVIMKRLGFKQVHTMKGNFFEVYQIPVDQIQATISMSVNDKSETSDNQMIEGELPF